MKHFFREINFRNLCVCVCVCDWCPSFKCTCTLISPRHECYCCTEGSSQRDVKYLPETSIMNYVFESSQDHQIKHKGQKQSIW